MLAVFAFWLIFVSTVTGWNRNVTGAFDRQDGLLAHLIYLLIAAAVWAVSRKNPVYVIQRAIQMFTAVAAGVSSIVLLQALGLMGIIGGAGLAGVGVNTTGATLGNRGYMGGLMALCLPFVLHWVKQRPQHWFLLTLITVAIVESWARGIWLSAAAALASYFWLKRSVPDLRVSMAIGIGLILPLLFPSPTREFSAGVFDNSGRTPLYHTALFGILQRPFQGWGADGVVIAAHSRPPSDLLKDLGAEVRTTDQINVLSRPENDSWIATVTSQIGTKSYAFSINKVHNEYLDYAVSYGVIAAGLFLLVLARACWNSRHVPTLFAATVAYATYLLTWPDVLRFAPLAWAAIGIGLAQKPNRPR